MEVKIYDCADLFSAGLWNRQLCCSDCHGRMDADFGFGMLIESLEETVQIFSPQGEPFFIRCCHVAHEELTRHLTITQLAEIPAVNRKQKEIVAEMFRSV